MLIPSFSRVTRTATGLALVFALGACGYGNDSGSTDEPKAAPVTTPAPVEAPAPVKADVVAAATPDADGIVLVEVGDMIRFSVTRIEVTAGQKFKIKLVHSGKQPKNIMGHNLVVLKPGTDIQAFGIAAAQARATEFIPEGSKADILGHTELIGGGETSEFEMVAPAPGTYEYVCSYPGHFAAMRGQLIVLEAGTSGAPSA